MSTVRIWGGALPVDDEGSIERSLDIPEAVYEAIERGIAEGRIEGLIQQQGGTRFQWFLDR